MRAILPRPETLLVAAAFPAVFVNIGHGQNGFLSAALLAGALLWLDRRPALAGLLFGLLAYKPQFGILIPLVLLVTGRWTVIGAASATVAALSAITWLVFGAGVWNAFAASAEFSRAVVLEAGATGWEKIQSIFSAVRNLGGPPEIAYAAQATLLLALAASLISLWRGRAAYDLKAAALVIACLLATPYVLDYDLMVLAVSIAFFVRHGLANGFRNYEITLLAVAWAMPLVARNIMGATGVPLGLLTLLALYVAILRRAAADVDAADRESVQAARTPVASR
jgi:alpha-1,2-mannosyltransferase